MTNEITCIICPKGCTITVEYKEGSITSVTGYTCDRGRDYATQEVLCPQRILATTIRIEEGGLLPIRSRTAIPKDKMMAAMREVSASSVHAPIKMGDVVIADVASTSIDMIASCDA